MLTDEQAVTPYEGFLDMSEATGFDWEARGRSLKWNILHLSPKMRLHALVVEAPMMLAFKVFERALRDHVEIHTKRSTFESAYALAVKGMRARGGIGSATAGVSAGREHRWHSRAHREGRRVGLTGSA